MMEWIIFALIAALIFGVRQVFTKKVLFEEHTTEYLTVTCMIVFLFSLFFFPFMDFNISGKILLIIYVKSLLLSIGWWLGARALRHLEISLVIPLTNLTPIFLIIWGILFLGEIPSMIQLGGVSFLIAGAYWLQSDHNFRNMARPWTILKSKFAVLMLVAVFLYSICSMLDKIVLQTVNSYTYLCLIFGILSIHYLIIQFVKYDGLRDIQFVINKEKAFVLIIPLFIIFADIFYLKAVAIPGAMVSLIIPIKRMSTLVSSIIGGRMFHDHNLGFRMIGGVMMILGAVLIAVSI